MSGLNIGRGTFYLGDCLEVMQGLPDSSFDMVLCDLPYGTTMHKWDSVIPLDQLWEQYWRLLKPGSAVVLTATQPFASALVTSQIKHFKYDWVWHKTKVTNFLHAKHHPLREHESVLVFGKGKTFYNPQGLIELDKPKVSKCRNWGSNWRKAKGEIPYVQTHGNYPRTVLNFPSVSKGFHPTQKPVELFEYLIRTYTIACTNGENCATVLDNTAGSGTTAIAAENVGCNWVCIERDPNYYDKAVTRIREHIGVNHAENPTELL